MKKCSSAGPQDKRAHLLWADAANELFETVARIVEVRQPIIETYYGEKKKTYYGEKKKKLIMVRKKKKLIMVRKRKLIMVSGL